MVQSTEQPNIYIRYAQFLLPLAITLVAVEMGGQVLSAGMARVPRATETLAAYGIAWALVTLFSSPLTHAKTVGMVLVNDEVSQRKALTFVVLTALLLMAGLALLALTPISFWVIEELHDIDSTLGDAVRKVLVWLIPLPLLKGMALLYTGQLIRIRRTVLVSAANIASISAGIVLIFLLLPLPFVQANPIWLPILAIHINSWVELAIVFWGYHHYKEDKPTIDGGAVGVGATTGTSTLTFADIFHFFWPLALVIFFQEGSRPLINIYIAQATEGPEALAILTVVYALGQFPYRWLNDVRNLHTAFQDEPNNLYYVRRFAVGCGFVSLAMMLVLFWTPVRTVLLQTLMGLDADFAQRCHAPLMTFTLFSPVVTLRSYAQGIAFLEKRTQILAISAPTRLGAIWLTLVGLPIAGVHGPTLGIAALAAGFAVESVTIWWGVRGRQWFKRS